MYAKLDYILATLQYCDWETIPSLDKKDYFEELPIIKATHPRGKKL